MIKQLEKFLDLPELGCNTSVTHRQTWIDRMRSMQWSCRASARLAQTSHNCVFYILIDALVLIDDWFLQLFGRRVCWDSPARILLMLWGIRPSRLIKSMYHWRHYRTSSLSRLTIDLLYMTNSHWLSLAHKLRVTIYQTNRCLQLSSPSKFLLIRWGRFFDA